MGLTVWRGSLGTDRFQVAVQTRPWNDICQLTGEGKTADVTDMMAARQYTKTLKNLFINAVSPPAACESGDPTS